MDFEVVVVGSGIIGLSLAKELSKKFTTLIVDKNKQVGSETSSRNSGVIHAGIYYKPGSLKANLCKEGNRFLYKYLVEKKIKFKKCGKLIVAKNIYENNQLKILKENSLLNGVKLLYLNRKETNKLEPELDCYSSLLSKSSGIMDTHDLMMNLVVDIESNNGVLLLNNKVSLINPNDKHIEFKLNREKKIFKTKVLINAAGLESYNLAQNINQLKDEFIPNVSFYKGNYFKLIGKTPFDRLIYPLPKKKSLGIHSTINLQNETLFGPDEEKVNEIDYNVDENRISGFIKSIEEYWPNIKNKKLVPDYAGIRGICNSKDFIIQTKKQHKINGLINLFNINSPGLTSSLSLAKYILKIVKQDKINSL